MPLIGLLLLGIIGVFALSALVAVIGVVLHAVVWLVVLPFRLLGAVVAGVATAFAFGIVAVVVAVLAVAFGLALLAPLLPLLIVGGLIWIVPRALRRPAVA